MIKYVLCVRDRASDSFGPPFCVPNVSMAIRSFGDLVNEMGSESLIHKHPEDYDLYQLGTFDDSCGEFACGAPKMVQIGKDLVRHS